MILTKGKKMNLTTFLENHMDCSSPKFQILIEKIDIYVQNHNIQEIIRNFCNINDLIGYCDEVQFCRFDPNILDNIWEIQSNLREEIQEITGTLLSVDWWEDTNGLQSIVNEYWKWKTNVGGATQCHS
jgi:hypothetical protein